MKRISLFVTVIFLSILCCCRKPTHETALVLSETEVSNGQPLIAKVINAPAGARFVWDLPAPVKQLSPDSSKAELIFDDFIDDYPDYGNHEIHVTIYLNADTQPYASYSAKVKVKPVDFKPTSSTSIVKPMTGDQLTLTPVFLRDSTLSFIEKTANSYNCLNAFITCNDSSVINGIIKTSCNGIVLPDVCEPANVQALGIWNTNAYYMDGTYPIEITFNSQVYRGSMTVTQNGHHQVFSWPYTTGVIIEPKVIQ